MVKIPIRYSYHSPRNVPYLDIRHPPCDTYGTNDENSDLESFIRTEGPAIEHDNTELCNRNNPSGENSSSVPSPIKVSFDQYDYRLF